MKHNIRSLTPLIATLMLSACGGGNAGMMNTAYSNPAAYGQQSGPMVNGQMMQPGQTTYAGMAQGQQAPQSPNLNAPIQQAPQQAMPAQQAAPQAAAPGSRTAPTLNKTTAAAAAKAPAAGTKAPAAAAPKQAQQAPAAPAAAKTPTAAEFLSKARQAIASVQSLSATVSTFEKVNGTSGTGKIQFLYRAGQVKIDVLASSDASRQGVKLAFQSGGNQVRVRPSGILSMVALNLPANDSKLLSGRKYQIVQIELTATVNRLTQPGTQAKILGKTTMGGAEVIVLEIISTNPIDNQVTSEHLGIDAQTFLPRMHEMYVGTDMVYAGRVEMMSVNPQLPGNAFEV